MNTFRTITQLKLFQYTAQNYTVIKWLRLLLFISNWSYAEAPKAEDISALQIYKFDIQIEYEFSEKYAVV